MHVCMGIFTQHKIYLNEYNTRVVFSTMSFFEFNVRYYNVYNGSTTTYFQILFNIIMAHFLELRLYKM